MPAVDYQNLISPAICTRSSYQFCPCFLCQKGRETLVPNSNCSNAPSAVKICFECKSTIAPGLEHNCTRQERNMNILEMVRELSEKSRSQIVSQSLKGISYNFNFNQKLNIKII